MCDSALIHVSTYHTPTPKTVFVAMPFSSTATCTEAEWLEIYENVFVPAVEGAGYQCQRAAPSVGSLIVSIVEKLRFANIVLADVTDRNPNVFYELGVRHALSKRTIITAQSTDHIPSDLRGYWHLVYGTSPGKVSAFRKDLARIISEIEAAPEKSDNPVSDFLDREQLGVSRQLNSENVKSLSALHTEFTGNSYSLMRLLENPQNRASFDEGCLNLLLQSLYMDPGPALLKRAYELRSNLRIIAAGERGGAILLQALEELESLTAEFASIREHLTKGSYSEPSDVSILEWKPSPTPSTNSPASMPLAGGLCAQAAVFMASKLLTQHAKNSDVERKQEQKPDC